MEEEVVTEKDNRQEFFSKEERQVLQSEPNRIKAYDNQDPPYSQFSQLSDGMYGKTDRIRKAIKLSVAELPSVKQNERIRKSARESNPSYWDTGRFGGTQKTIEAAQNDLLASEWAAWNPLNESEDGYLHVGMKETEKSFNDNEDIKIHINPEVSSTPVAAFAIAAARERLKEEGIEFGFKVAIRKPAYKIHEKSDQNPPRIVLYPADQTPEGIKKVVAVVEEALSLTEVKNDSQYRPRFSQQLTEGSPIYFAQGLGHDKSTNPQYKAQYGDDGLFKEQARATINSVLQ